MQPAEAATQPAEAAPAIPDDLRLILMIRNAVIALNQANTTGNYSVLRELGTPSFQMTNSPARLAEIFSALRTRKIDLSPVMAFNPKLASAPVLQEGQVLRLTGFFPTSPEQVQFDLAFHHFREQWMLAGIAVTVAPPGDGAQASAASGGELAQMTVEAGSASSGRPGEAKAIRIDLGQPVAPQGKQAAPKKPAAVRKPKPPAQKTAVAQAPSTQASAPETPPAAPAQAEPAAAESAPKSTGFGSGWNPFGR
ncbi:MAG: hypothetical protein ACLPWS_00760 [Rhodomicrobium sp.]